MNLQVKPSIHHIWIPIYDKQITVILVNSIDDASMPYIAKQLEAPLDELREIVTSGSEGLTLYNRSKLWCALVFPIKGNTLSIESLSHECFHAAHRIASYVSIVFDFENQEPIAYLMGYLAEQVSILLHKRGIMLGRGKCKWEVAEK